MTGKKINPQATAAREAARIKGRFGAQQHSAPETTLGEPEKPRWSASREARARQHRETMAASAASQREVTLKDDATQGYDSINVAPLVNVGKRVAAGIRAFLL